MNGAEADLMRQRLAAAGIPAISQRSIGSVEWGSGAAEYVYVEAKNATRARELLSSGQDIDDDELSRQSEAAGEPPPD